MKYLTDYYRMWADGAKDREFKAYRLAACIALWGLTEDFRG